MVEPGNENEWTLDFFTFPPENQGWTHVNSSNYTRDEIYQHLVLTGEHKSFLQFHQINFWIKQSLAYCSSHILQCKIPAIEFF